MLIATAETDDVESNLGLNSKYSGFINCLNLPGGCAGASVKETSSAGSFAHSLQLLQSGCCFTSK